MDCSPPGFPPMEFSRREYWTELPFPPPLVTTTTIKKISRNKYRRGCTEKGILWKSWWECERRSHEGKQPGGSFETLNPEVLYDPEIPLLGLHLEEFIIWNDMCTPIFKVALFTIAETQKPIENPRTESWTLAGTFMPWNTTQPRDRKNNGIGCSIDGLKNFHTKWGKSETKSQISQDITYKWNL